MYLYGLGPYCATRIRDCGTNLIRKSMASPMNALQVSQVVICSMFCSETSAEKKAGLAATSVRLRARTSSTIVYNLSCKMFRTFVLTTFVGALVGYDELGRIVGMLVGLLVFGNPKIFVGYEVGSPDGIIDGRAEG